MLDESEVRNVCAWARELPCPTFVVMPQQMRCPKRGKPGRNGGKRGERVVCYGPAGRGYWGTYAGGGAARRGGVASAMLELVRLGL